MVRDKTLLDRNITDVLRDLIILSRHPSDVKHQLTVIVLSFTHGRVGPLSPQFRNPDVGDIGLTDLSVGVRCEMIILWKTSNVQ